MDIKCIFYAEFDLIAGPMIVTQYPDQFIQPDTFKAIQTFVIPSKALCGNLIIVILPPDLDEDEEIAGGGIPDEDGWIYLRKKRKEKASGEETPKRKPGSERA
jgi:hypothetical protein